MHTNGDSIELCKGSVWLPGSSSFKLHDNLDLYSCIAFMAIRNRRRRGRRRRERRGIWEAGGLHQCVVSWSSLNLKDRGCVECAVLYPCWSERFVTASAHKQRGALVVWRTTSLREVAAQFAQTRYPLLVGCVSSIYNVALLNLSSTNDGLFKRSAKLLRCSFLASLRESWSYQAAQAPCLPGPTFKKTTTSWLLSS